MSGAERMLVNLASILAPAADDGYGVAAFNVFGWEDARAVADAAEALGAPVILSASLDYTRFTPVEVIARMFRAIAETAPVPICAHLDHTYEIEPILRAVDAGFTSVMFDGSQRPLAENIAGLRRVVDHAHAAGCSVEGEVGSVPYAEGRPGIRAELTEPEEACRVATESGIDALAVSVGNVHRLLTPGVAIDFGRLAAIEAATAGVPLVIHGTSGIKPADLERLALSRVAKFNIGTTLRQAFGRGLRAALDEDLKRFDRLEIMRTAMPYMQREAERMIALLGWAPRAAPVPG